MHVCFVDDRYEEIEGLLNFIESKGHGVSHYDWVDGGRAFLADQMGRPELVVLLDLYFNGKRLGPEILEAIRQARPGVPVIVFTGQEDLETRYTAIHDWGANDVFPKSSSQFDKLLPVLERCALEDRDAHLKLKRALKLANEPNLINRLEGLRLCDEIIASTRQPHVSALRGKCTALWGILGQGVLQQQLPLTHALLDLRETCRILDAELAEPDRENLTHWIAACRHLEDTVGMQHAIGTSLARLPPADGAVLNVIARQLNETPSAEEGASGLMACVDSLEDEARPAVHLKLARTLSESERGRRSLPFVAACYVERLARAAINTATRALEGGAEQYGERFVLDVLELGDPCHSHAPRLIRQMVDDRLHAGPEPGALVRTEPLLRQLRKWRGTDFDPVWFQRTAAKLVVDLHLLDGLGSVRDHCLELACTDEAHDLDAVCNILAVLADCDQSRLCSLFDGWLERANKSGDRAVAEGLIAWVEKKENRDMILRGPIELPGLQRIIGCLVRSGRREAAGRYVVGAVSRALAELPLVGKPARKPLLIDLGNLLGAAEKTAIGESIGEVEVLRQKYTAALAAELTLPKLLTNRNVVIVAGTEQAGGDAQLQRYKPRIDDIFGCDCDIYSAERRGQAACEAIRHGGADVVVLVLGTMGHADSGRIVNACDAAISQGFKVVKIQVPQAEGTGPDAVSRVILDALTGGEKA